MAAEKCDLISIIVPVYNEADNLFPLSDALHEVCTSEQYDYELIFVNDGSRDGSAEILDRLAAGNPRCKVIHLKRNHGQTAALMAGIEHARGDILIPMDADLQNDPKDIPRLLEKIHEGYDVVSGWRKERKDAFWTRLLPSFFANRLISRISGVALNDYGCTLKAYRRSILEDVKLYGEMHRFIPIFAAWAGARTIEVPVSHNLRVRGKSNYGMERVFKVLLDLMVVKFLSSYAQKPIYVFGGFGLFNHLLALITFALMVYLKYWGGTSFISTPLPLLAVLFLLMGFISILLGLIAELLIRTYHESQGKRTYLVRKTCNIEEGEDTGEV